ncbi:MAG: amino acid ABC transporter substrate-binding protein, partial [Deltaproteobacteria bacterium]|nr:amino acid ABC transporter substrate-binding protein [Deltaproteobacteria bacterium]
MKKVFYFNLLVLSFLAAHVFGYAAYAQEPIILGVPTSTGFIEGKEALKAVNLAVEEINAKGGV